MRILGIIVGLAVAAFGGVLAYRAYHLKSIIVITDTSVREGPNMLRVASGVALVAIGAAIAFFAARRKPM